MEKVVSGAAKLSVMTEVGGLNPVEPWVEWFWINSDKDGNPLSEVILFRTTASTSGDWLMVA